MQTRRMSLTCQKLSSVSICCCSLCRQACPQECLQTESCTVHCNLCVAVQHQIAASISKGILFLPSSVQITLMWCMSGCNTTYVQPERDDRLGIAHGVCPSTLQQSLEAAAAAGKQIKAVMVVSPTYFGAISNIKGRSAGHCSVTQDMAALAHVKCKHLGYNHACALRTHTHSHLLGMPCLLAASRLTAPQPRLSFAVLAYIFWPCLTS